MRRAIFWLAFAVALVALFGGSLYAFVAYRQTSGPDGAVRGYFTALERGDAEGALGFGLLPDGRTNFLTDQVLAQQLSIAPMRGATVEAVSRTGNHAEVGYRYALHFPDGERRYSGVLRLIDQGDGWRLEAAAVPVRLSITQALDRFDFAGTTAPTDGPVLLFPGALPVHFDTPYLQLDRATRAVGFSRTAGARPVAVRLQPTPAADRLLTARLRARLRTCVQPGSASVACPQPSPRTIPGSLRGRLLSVKCTYVVSSEASGAITVNGSAFVQGSYRNLDYQNVARTHRGRIVLPVDATAYPVRPLVVAFSDVT